MNKTLFQTKIWKSRIDFIDKKNLIEKYEKEYLKNPKKIPNGWQCDIHSSFSTNTNNFKSGYIPNQLICLIEDKIDEFLEYNNLLCKENYYISNIWFNIYKENQFQEPHTHGTSLFSGCYYLKFNKMIHEQTIFYNPNFNINYKKVEDIDYFFSDLDCNEDDIIIFPSNVKHGTKGLKKKCDESRITISFNVENNFSNFNEKIKYTYT
jgi:uncharacterized protein (TIGR02466 family)